MVPAPLQALEAKFRAPGGLSRRRHTTTAPCLQRRSQACSDSFNTSKVYRKATVLGGCTSCKGAQQNPQPGLNDFAEV
jgi:hypothetical protein